MKTYCLHSSSSSFQQRDDKKCVHAVIDACYESAAQRSNKDLFSFDISCKDIIEEEEIASCDKPAYHHDEFGLRKYGEGEQKCSDQLLSLHFDPKKVEQSTFNIDISKEKYQQHKKVFPVGFYDPVANYLELISSIDIKIFFSDDSWFCHRSNLYHCMLGFHLFFRSRSRISSADQFLTWLNWKHDVS